MILKCKHCGGYLYYDADSKKMLCPYCYSSYEVSEFGEEAEAEIAGAPENSGTSGTFGAAKSSAAAAGAQGPSAGRQAQSPSGSAAGAPQSTAQAAKDGPYIEEAPQEPEETMETTICNCTSCGAKLMVNDVESATFCAYCGQPTIVYERVSKIKKPKYIVPFTITKEQAHDIIKSKFGAGMYVPDEIKNFEPDILRGIYIPFMVYDIDYYDRQLLKGVQEKKNSTETYYYYREASSVFRGVTADASTSFNDRSSQRLEPYHMKYKEPFQIGYLSGYYADCFDEDSEKTKQTAISRCKELFDAEILKNIPGCDRGLLINGPQVKIKSADYVLLPVWFLVFHEGNIHHTIMVNGQTGKLVGAVPCDSGKVRRSFVVHCAIYSTIAALVGGALFSQFWRLDEPLKAVMALGGFCLCGIITLFQKAQKQYRAYEDSQRLTRAIQIKRLAADRQGVQ